LAVDAVTRAEDGYFVTISPPTRSLDQSDKLHAMLGDIAKQVEWHGCKLDADVWKRLCTAACLREQHEQPTMVPALDGSGFDVIYEKTSKMTVKQMSALIDWVQAFGDQNGVRFTG
jgi:hypothetical protein